MLHEQHIILCVLAVTSEYLQGEEQEEEQAAKRIKIEPAEEVETAEEVDENILTENDGLVFNCYLTSSNFDIWYSTAFFVTRLW